jgi:hypothetical protein
MAYFLLLKKKNKMDKDLATIFVREIQSMDGKQGDIIFH